MIYQKRELLCKPNIFGKWFNITKFEYDNKIGISGEYRKLVEENGKSES